MYYAVILNWKETREMPAPTVEELIRVGREMRTYQKRFHSATKNSPEWKDYLGHSKYWEGLFDKLIKEPDAHQTEMFADPFPPLPHEPETRTLEERILDAAMRDCKK